MEELFAPILLMQDCPWCLNNNYPRLEQFFMESPLEENTGIKTLLLRNFFVLEREWNG